jgi:GNAT superfamily N-acetyltransferase
MSGYQVLERDFSSFFDVPFAQYGEGQRYVSPLRSDLAVLLDGDRNPSFRGRDRVTFFTVVRDGVPMGRISAQIHDAANERWDAHSGSFGFFDCADDPVVSRLLILAASTWLSERGCDDMVGNFNLTAMQEIGVVTEGHDRAPFLAQVHNPSWTAALLERSGLEPTFPMTSWRLPLRHVDPASLRGPRQEQLAGEPTFSVTPVTRGNFRRSMAATHELLNASFDDNPFFVPLDRSEFELQASQMLWILDPRISFIVHLNGAPAGVIACLPDVNPLLRRTRSRLSFSTPWHYARFRARRRRATLVFGGVRPELQNRGMAGLLLEHAIRGLQGAGYDELGITWISDSNHPSLRQMEKLGAERLHRLALYRRSLS